MFKITDNESIGKYLAECIARKYDSQREFGRQYLIAEGNADPSAEVINNMANRLSQIIKGKKAIQLRDLPIFTELLCISCEQLLSAGKHCMPLVNRATNYSIACSQDPKEWEKYIHHKDKPILNADEYCQTVLDYALEYKNYAFIQFLMDHGYIWFDSGRDSDYVQTFGAGTSIKRRHIGAVDCDLQNELATEDALRVELIMLACDNGDIQMLEKLKAREIPQLYFCAHYLSWQHPDIDSYYNERLVKHIASANDLVLNYFTEPFVIRDHIHYKDGISRNHTFMFPYLSQLLDHLVVNNPAFAEIAIKKAIKHNEEVYQKLRALVLSVKNDPRYSADYMRDLWSRECEQDLAFFENGNIVMFRAIYSYLSQGKQVDGIITNVPHITQTPSSPTLKFLADQLNESHLKIKNMKTQLKEIK